MLNTPRLTAFLSFAALLVQSQERKSEISLEISEDVIEIGEVGHRHLAAVDDDMSLLTVMFGSCQCIGVFDCNENEFALPTWLDFLVDVFVLLYSFKGLGIICDEYFVPSLEGISDQLQLSNDVAGATFMAAGSSAPELFTSLMATFIIVNEGGVGTIIGSAIFNILVIVGATCFFAGIELRIWWYPLTRDSFFYVLSIAEMSLFMLDEKIEIWESIIMVLSYVGYCFFMKFNGRVAAWVGNRYGHAGDKVVAFDKPVDGTGASDQEKKKDADPEKLATEAVKTSNAPQASGSMSSQPGSRRHSLGENKIRAKTHLDHEKIYTSMSGLRRASRASNEDIADAAAAAAEVETPRTPLGHVLHFLYDPLNWLWEMTMPNPDHFWILFYLSILWIAVLTYIMVDSCNRMGCILNISPLVMGLIFLAAGTSVPDCLGSIAVAKQGEGDMAVSNAIGSNVFDILLGMGLPWTLKILSGGEVTYVGVKDDLLKYIIILTCILFLFVGALKANKWILNKFMGGVLMVIYTSYVVYTLVSGGE